jgi:protoporphyrinogen oxidase
VLSVLRSRRTLPGRRLFRVLLGGARHPDVLTASDEALRDEAEGVLRDTTGEQGRLLYWRVRRHADARPLYECGHRARLARIAALLAAAPGLHLTGCSYHASSVAGCIRHARRLAESLAHGPLTAEAR